MIANKWRSVAPLVVAFTCLAGAPAQPAAPQFGSISGRVRDEDKRPIADATVRLHPLTAPFSGRAGQWGEAIAETKTDGNGNFRFADPDGSLFSTAMKRMFMVAVASEGHARAFRKTTLEEGRDASVDVLLSEPVSVAIRLRDESGLPVRGASLRHLSVHGENGEFDPRGDDLEKFGLALDRSDADGWLRLPELPRGAVVDAMIRHRDLAAIEVKGIAIRAGNVVDATLKPGVPVFLRIAPTDQGGLPPSIVILMRERHLGSGHPSTMWFEGLPLDETGAAKVTVEAGEYWFPVLSHENLYITCAGASADNSLNVAAGNRYEFSFRARRKVRARGRVIDALTSKPVPGVTVDGQIAGGTPNAEGGAAPNDWSYVASVETDEHGEYTIPLAAGPARLEAYSGDYIADGEPVGAVIAADGSTVVPDLKVRRLPKVSGTVRDAEGRPVARAIVRMRTKDGAAWRPAVTDDRGNFEMELPRWLVYDSETGKPLGAQPLVAFHLSKPLSAKVEVKLNEPDAISNLNLVLEPHPCRTLLPEHAQNSRAKTDAVAALAAKLNAESLLGKPAPELDGLVWINAQRESMGLADFRGKYVLLDFWTTWCGPCHADFPILKLLHRQYQDRGLIVIGIHDNSVAPDAVREHVKRQELDFPIVIDTPDGRIMSRYERHGVRFRPSYLLIGPDGNVLFHDAIDPESQLSSYMPEIVRAYLIGEQ